MGSGGSRLEPSLEIKTYPKFEAVTCSAQGWRPKMEDRHVTLSEIAPGVFYSAVFDGHGGPKTAEFAQQHLQTMIRDSNFFKKRDFARACVEGFILTDRLISQKIDESSGSTATAVLIDHDQVYCGNIGDSRAIGSYNGHCCPLSFDHKPNRSDELKRIEDGGGWVEYNRVNGALAMSRALGDFFFKQNLDAPLHKQIVTAIPDVTISKLADLEFIVLACDGIFDVMNNTEVIKFVRSRLAQRIHPKEIAQRLVTVCIADTPSTDLPGCDNTTVTILYRNDLHTLYKRCASSKSSSRPGLAMSDEEYALTCGIQEL